MTLFNQYDIIFLALRQFLKCKNVRKINVLKLKIMEVKIMKKVGRKIAAMLCMLSAAVPSNIKAKEAESYIVNEHRISSSNKQYEQMFKKAT